MGTPDFAVPTLEALARSAHEVVAVVTQPDSPRGRGQKLAPPKVKIAAEALGVQTLQPPCLKSKHLAESLSAYDPDLFVVVAFSILPSTILEVPLLGSINLHPSLLPKYRGAAPINWAVIRGEEETGITTFLLSARVDAGDVLIQERTPIGPDETAGELYERLKHRGAEIVVATVDGLASGDLVASPQSNVEATPAPKLTKETGRIDWTAAAFKIRNLVRGTNPFPGAFTMWGDSALKVHRVSEVRGSGPAGEVVSADDRTGIVVAAGSGALRLDEVQPQGKRSMDGTAFIRGYRVDVGTGFR